MVMICNIYTCNISYFVNFVTNIKYVIPVRCCASDRNTGQGDRDGGRFRKEAVCRSPLPPYPPAIGAVANPDRRRPRHLAELYQSDRAQPAPGDGADPAPFGGSL